MIVTYQSFSDTHNASIAVSIAAGVGKKACPPVDPSLSVVPRILSEHYLHIRSGSG